MHSMITKTLSKILLSLPFLLLIIDQSPLFAAPDINNDRATLTKPNNLRPKLQAENVTTMFDGMPNHSIQLANSYIKLHLPAINGWTKNDDPTDTSSFSLVKNYGKDVKDVLTFSLYQAGELLSDFNPSTLKGYADLLKSEFPGKTVKILNEDKEFFVENTFFIFGKTYRLVEFTVSTPTTSQYYRDYLVLTEDPHFPLIIIRHFGPQNIVTHCIPDVENAIRFSYIIKDAQAPQ